MKNQFFYLFICLSISLIGQSDNKPTGLPGDNFSLEGALELFKNANSPEDFEKQLNIESNNVNNLDLDGNGDIDYIRVVAQKDEDVQIFVLQVPVSSSENQDIAVIQIEKNGQNEAILQVIGDEDIFGEEIIIEPSDVSDEEEDSEIQRGPSMHALGHQVVVNVWTWPIVRHVYSPAYRPWVSPYRWGFYPTWYRPWRPLAWNIWNPIRIRHYRPTVRVVTTHRVVKAHRIYKPTRVTSTTVRTKHAAAHANYKVNRTKTTVRGPKGNTTTKKTTTVKGSKGNVKAQRSTVKKSRKG